MTVPEARPEGPDQPGKAVPPESLARWGNLELLNDAFSADVYWLAHPLVQERYRRRATGSPDLTWAAWVARRLSDAAVVVSVGSGTGGFERDLRAHGFGGRLVGVEPAGGAVAEARRASQGLGIEYVATTLDDFLRRRAEPVDAIVWNSSLHHSQDPDGDLRLAREALRPNGFVAANEYVGAPAFAFGPAQVELISRAWALLPDDLRRSCIPGRDREILPAPPIPDPVEVAAVDPTEAVRSDLIVGALRRHFDIVEWNPCGGQLLQSVLSGVCGNFRDEVGLAWLRVLFALEDAVEASGVAPSDFVSVLATPRAADDVAGR